MTELPAGLTVRPARLDDAAEAARVAAFVADQPEGTPFHLPAWGQATARATGQAFTLLLAEQGRALAAVLPLTTIRSRLFGSALVSTGFGVGGGPLGATGAQATLIRRALAIAEADEAPTLELRGGTPPQGPGWNLLEGRYLGFARSIAADDAAELAAIPRKQRAEVRKALAADLEVVTGRSTGDLAEHFAVYGESVRNLGTPVFPRALFRTVLDAFGPEGADILTVRHAGKPVASVLSLYWRGTVYPYWGGGTRAARALRANDAMYFALMRHARERGCTRFDFGRSKAGTGPAAFKKNWGFTPEPLGYATWTRDGAAPRDASPLNPKYRLKIAAWQRLPLGIANRLGPWIARGLG
ncbi:FemAB family PEP-CTERM system-associated protein [Sphingomonas sp. PL-96]|uniref:FemAB family XrtA/PEP-CTERM system-associated protein n=1 Tax=Sphingomonas sp. PL-96 TaxID=2887201 RepID=UPI001E5CB789|nr:FemAB family XrtA/PEP-CTERM system-associated protein [Sphingomonas sp. PL-96]MCC2975607.1 FemAB family PEP-CTERM system-associated protein [Sphingomonas sp. PL-96]